MKDTKTERTRRQVLRLRQQFLHSGTDLFDQALGGQEMSDIATELIPAHRERLYAPLDTLRLFIDQVLSTDRACQSWHSVKGSLSENHVASE